MFFISSNNFLKDSDTHQKYWIHRVDAEIIHDIDEVPEIASKKRKSLTLNKLSVGDRILLVSKFNNSLKFFAYTQVGELYQDNRKLHGYYSSRRKLRLKGIKYFSKTIPIAEVSAYLDFVNDSSKVSSYFKSEYREISKENFIHILRKSPLTKSSPPYLEDITMTFKEFMISTIKSVYRFVKHYEKRSQIEIKSFLKLVRKFLESYGIKKSMDEIQDFYSYYAIELGFRHIPSRDLDKFVPLYMSNGEKKNFAYISLE